MPKPLLLITTLLRPGTDARDRGDADTRRHCRITGASEYPGTSGHGTTDTSAAHNEARGCDLQPVRGRTRLHWRGPGEDDRNPHRGRPASMEEQAKLVGCRDDDTVD